MTNKNLKLTFVYNLKRSDALEEAEFDTQQVVNEISEALSKASPCGLSVNVAKVEMTRDEKWIGELISTSPDIVFNTTEGFRGVGRESYAPTVFEQLGIPFVGSNAYSCFLTLNKELCKQVVKRSKVSVPFGYVVQDEPTLLNLLPTLDFPVFLKPNFEGSSKGITGDSLCYNVSDVESYWRKFGAEFPEGILIEQYLPGKDITVPFINGLGDDGILESIEYTGPLNENGQWIYDYDLKNTDDSSVGLKCPANIGENAKDLAREYMKKSVKALGILDFARADFRVGPLGEVYFLEINALPSLQKGAGIFEAAAKLGLDYNQTISYMLEAGVKRYGLESSASSKVYVAPQAELFRSKSKKAKVALVYNQKRKLSTDADYEDEAEFDSEETIRHIALAIEKNGYKPTLIEANASLADELVKNDIDVVFNIAEGRTKRGREAQVPAICDFLGIEHTGSDATTLSLSLDKALCNKIVESEGVRVPKSILVKDLKSFKLPSNFKFPMIAKPNFEGTSKGIYDKSVVDSEKDLALLLKELFDKFTSPVLVQEYLIGREFTIGILGSAKNPFVFKPSEIVFNEKSGKHPVYSYEKKQMDIDKVNEYLDIVSPAKVNDKEWKKMRSFAKKVYSALDCRDVARIDFKMLSDGELGFIEINPLPGLSPGFSDLTIMAEKQGMDYSELIGKVLKPALRRRARVRVGL